MSEQNQEVDLEIAKLSSRAQKLRETFATEGWKEIIFPGILAVRNVYNNGLISGHMEERVMNEDGSSTKRIIPDAELRAVVKTCGWFAGWELDLETTQSALAQAVVAAQMKQASGTEQPSESVSGSPLVAQDN